jgi:hypothetical protein
MDHTTGVTASRLVGLRQGGPLPKDRPYRLFYSARLFVAYPRP